MPTKAKKPTEKSINQKMQDLETQIDWFYSDDFSLDEATERYEKAASLAKEIEVDLDNLKNNISIIQKDFTKGEH